MEIPDGWSATLTLIRFWKSGPSVGTITEGTRNADFVGLAEYKGEVRFQTKRGPLFTMDKDDIQLLYEYDRWANNRVLQEVAALSTEQFTCDLGGSFRSVRDTLLHITRKNRRKYQFRRSKQIWPLVFSYAEVKLEGTVQKRGSGPYGIRREGPPLNWTRTRLIVHSQGDGCLENFAVISRSGMYLADLSPMIETLWPHSTS